MLHQETKEFLKHTKNLLAFSGGSDSSALFFLLKEAGVAFDIAIVDYALREQSAAELSYAQELARRYSLECHTLQSPKITQNFEADARKVRYDFFHTLIEKHGYTTLITAHHLADRLEWFLMQLCKGAGCVELLGMREFEKKDSYTLVRPLLHVNKKDIHAYLQKHKIHFFHDESNDDIRYKRNLFRHKYAAPLLEEYAEGIAKSFEFIERDNDTLASPVEIQKVKELCCFKSLSPRSDLVAIDRCLKSLGKVLSRSERALLEAEDSVVVGRKYVVSKSRGFVFIAPYLQQKGFDKAFKEQCRLMGINPKLRPYLFVERDLLEFVSELLE